MAWWLAATVSALRQPLAPFGVPVHPDGRTKRWIEIGYDVWKMCPRRAELKLLQLVYRFAVYPPSVVAQGEEDVHIRSDQRMSTVCGGGKKVSQNFMMRENFDVLPDDRALLKHWTMLRASFYSGATTVRCRTLRGWWRYMLIYHSQDLPLDYSTISFCVRDIAANPESRNISPAF